MKLESVHNFGPKSKQTRNGLINRMKLRFVSGHVFRRAEKVFSAPGSRDCVATTAEILRWNKKLENRSNQPRSGGYDVSPARERRVKWGMILSRAAAAWLRHSISGPCPQWLHSLLKNSIILLR